MADGCGSLISESSADRNAARVLPDPVGAMTSAFCPDEMACHAPACAAVGSANTSANQVAVAGLNAASGSAAVGV